jgi:hypothetical protein
MKLIRVRGCVIPRHVRSEEMLSGRLRLNEKILGPGDLLRTEARESHEALEKTRLLVMNTADPR